MPNKKVMCLAGDGVGPELMKAAYQVIEYFNEKSNITLDLINCDFGGSSIEKNGTPFPQHTKDTIKEVDAILLSAIGDARYDKAKYTPEAGLLDLRKSIDAYINIRPIKPHHKIAHLTSFKTQIIENVDITFYRELSSGAYFGKPRELRENDAIDTIYYSTTEIRRIVEQAFEFCKKTNKKLTSVDKANVLATSKLWRAQVDEIAKEYPEVEYEHRLVDSCVLDLVNNPAQFDCIVTDNLFGDILSDQAASLMGSLGMLASASFGTTISLYEPGHGSAPNIANMNIVNPIAMIKSVAMMYLHSFSEIDIANAIEKAIDKTIEDNIMSKDLNNQDYVTTTEMVAAIIERIEYHGDSI